MPKIAREKFKVFEGVFDEKTLEVLETLKRKKYFDELGKPIKTGKEGDVYLAKKDGELRAIKIYRVTSANFKKISKYIIRDFRFKSIKGSMRKVILAWSQKEFRNLSLCHTANINVPYPYKHMQNVIIMDYIDGPMLKDTVLKNPQKCFNLLVEQITLMLQNAKLIHGDLSEFNTLVKDDIPYLIDWGQGMSIKNEEDFKKNEDLFIRDIENIVKYFNKTYSLEIEIYKVIEQIKTTNPL